MRTKGKDDKSTLNFIMFFLALLLAILYAFIWYKNSLFLEIIALSITFLLFLSNFYYIKKSIHDRKKSRKMIKEKNVIEIDKSPLESYLLKSIWNYNSVFISKGKFASLLEYEIMIGHIINDDESLQISLDIDLDSLDIYEKYIIETAFLDQISFKRTDQFKLEKLKNIQKKELRIALIEVDKNINFNLAYNSQISFLVAAVKEEYFEEIKSNVKVVIETLSYLSIVFNLIMAVVSIKQASLFNFYLPISVSFLIWFLITNNYYGMLVLKTSKMLEVSDMLNYVGGLKKRKLTEKEQKYVKCIKNDEPPVRGLLRYARISICGIPIRHKY